MARSAELVVTEGFHLAGPLRAHRIACGLPGSTLDRLVAMAGCEAEKLSGLALGTPRPIPSSERRAPCGAVNADLALQHDQAMM